MYVSNPSACHGNETSTLKHTLSNFIKNQTFGASRRLLSMYVCLKTLSLSWKLASNKNRLMMIWTKNVSTCSKTLSLSWKSNIHTRLNFLEFHIFESFSDAFKHVCMFQIPLPVMENETYTLKYTRSIHLKPCFAYLNKYVCVLAFEGLQKTWFLLGCVMLELQKPWQAEGFWTFFQTYLFK